MLELFHNDMSTCSQKVRMALAEKGLEWTSHHLNLRAADQQKPDYLALNPNGVVPTITDGDDVDSPQRLPAHRVTGKWHLCNGMDRCVG